MPGAPVSGSPAGNAASRWASMARTGFPGWTRGCSTAASPPLTSPPLTRAAARAGTGPYACGWPMLTSQVTPNLSVHMPNSSPQSCFRIGIVTVPPSDSLSQ